MAAERKGALTVRAVLLSIKPEWWEKILAGEKDLEIRKTVPRGGAGEPEPWPLLVLAYVSGTGAVLGQFLCMGWVKSNCWRYLSSRACVPEEDLKNTPAENRCMAGLWERRRHTTPPARWQSSG